MIETVPYQIVTLTAGEYLWGCHGAIMRQADSMARGLKPANNLREGIGGALRKNVVGFLGELAFAKFIGAYPSGAFSFRAVDVGEWEVKTRSEHEYLGEPARLILQADSNPDRRYVLLTGAGPSFRVHGWILGRAALQHPTTDLAGNKRPAIWIEQDLLTRFEKATPPETEKP